MHNIIIILAPALLVGCAPLAAATGRSTPAGHVDALRAIGEHMEGCDRHYQGSLGLGGSFTFNIDCKSRKEPQAR